MKLIFSILVFISLSFSNLDKIPAENTVNSSEEEAFCSCKYDQITKDCWDNRGQTYCFAQGGSQSGLCDGCVVIDPEE